MEPLAKLSLYDILTQLISGFLILALFIPIPESTLKCICMEDGIEIYHWIFLIIFSYLIGIIYHRLLEWFRSVKLEKWLMVISLFVPAIVVMIKQLQSILPVIIPVVILVVIAFFILVIIAFFIAAVIKCEKFQLFFLTIFYRNNKKVIAKANNGKYNTKKIKDEELSFIEKEYYDTYYSVMDKPAYGTINILETQEAFLRNITWIVVAYHLCYYFSWIEDTLFECIFIVDPPSILSSNCLILCVSLFSFLFLILFARYHTQMKVYGAVWEAGKYVQNSSETEIIIDIKK